MSHNAGTLIDRSRVRLFPRYVDIHDVTEHTLLHALSAKKPALCPACLELLNNLDVRPEAQFKHRCERCNSVTSDPIAVEFDTDYEP